MALDTREVLDALALADPIELAGMLREADAAIADSESLGRNAEQLAKEIAMLADQFLQLKNKAVTPEGAAIFDARLSEAVGRIAISVHLTAAQKTVIEPFIAALLA